MATTTLQTSSPRGVGRTILAVLKMGFAAVMRFLCDLSEARRCALELQRLTALSDAELARRGIRRDEIVSYVFRNHMHE